MSGNPLFGEAEDAFGAPQVREERPYKREYRVTKPAAVSAAAARAEKMQRRLIAGDTAGALALVTEEDLMRRKGEAEKRDPVGYHRRLSAALASTRPSRPAIVVVHQGREMGLEEAVAAGYQPTGREGEREP